MRQEAQYGCGLEAPGGKGLQGKENKPVMAAVLQNISPTELILSFFTSGYRQEKEKNIQEKEEMKEKMHKYINIYE